MKYPDTQQAVWHKRRERCRKVFRPEKELHLESVVEKEIK